MGRRNFRTFYHPSSAFRAPVRPLLLVGPPPRPISGLKWSSPRASPLQRRRQTRFEYSRARDVGKIDTGPKGGGCSRVRDGTDKDDVRDQTKGTGRGQKRGGCTTRTRTFEGEEISCQQSEGVLSQITIMSPWPLSRSAAPRK